MSFDLTPFRTALVAWASGVTGLPAVFEKQNAPAPAQPCAILAFIGIRPQGNPDMYAPDDDTGEALSVQNIELLVRVVIESSSYDECLEKALLLEASVGNFVWLDVFRAARLIYTARDRMIVSQTRVASSGSRQEYRVSQDYHFFAVTAIAVDTGIIQAARIEMTVDAQEIVVDVGTPLE